MIGDVRQIMPAPTGAFAVFADKETGEAVQRPIVCLAVVVGDEGQRYIAPMTMETHRRGECSDPRDSTHFVMIRFASDRLTDADVQVEARKAFDRIAKADKEYEEWKRRYAAEQAAKLAEVAAPPTPTGNTNWNVTL